MSKAIINKISDLNIFIKKNIKDAGDIEYFETMLESVSNLYSYKYLDTEMSMQALYKIERDIKKSVNNYVVFIGENKKFKVFMYVGTHYTEETVIITDGYTAKIVPESFYDKYNINYFGGHGENLRDFYKSNSPNNYDEIKTKKEVDFRYVDLTDYILIYEE